MLWHMNTHGPQPTSHGRSSGPVLSRNGPAVSAYIPKTIKKSGPYSAAEHVEMRMSCIQVLSHMPDAGAAWRRCGSGRSGVELPKGKPRAAPPWRSCWRTCYHPLPPILVFWHNALPNVHKPVTVGLFGARGEIVKPLHRQIKISRSSHSMDLPSLPSSKAVQLGSWSIRVQLRQASAVGGIASSMALVIATINYRYYDDGGIVSISPHLAPEVFWRSMLSV